MEQTAEKHNPIYAKKVQHPVLFCRVHTEKWLCGKLYRGLVWKKKRGNKIKWVGQCRVI